MWFCRTTHTAYSGAATVCVRRSFFAKPASGKPSVAGAPDTAPATVQPQVRAVTENAGVAAAGAGAGAATPVSPKLKQKTTPAKRAAAREPEVVVVDDDDVDDGDEVAPKRARTAAGAHAHAQQSFFISLNNSLAFVRSTSRDAIFGEALSSDNALRVKTA